MIQKAGSVSKLPSAFTSKDHHISGGAAMKDYAAEGLDGSFAGQHFPQLVYATVPGSTGLKGSGILIN